jgi:two-component system nitrate/nitrite response regulator NarL
MIAVRGGGAPSLPPENNHEQSHYRLLIVEDRELIRAGTVGLLSGQPYIDGVHEASTGLDALSIVQRVPLDLVLVDDSLPGTDTVQLIETMRQVSPTPDLKIVLMLAPSSQAARTRIDEVRKQVDGYFHKTDGSDEILSVVHGVLTARQSRPRPEQDQGAARPVIEPPEAPGAERLTPRELQVLVLVAQGLSNQVIAGRLGIKPGTVKTYVERIIGKLGVSSRLEAAVRALKLGLLD